MATYDADFDTWGRDDLGYAPAFPTTSAIPNTSNAKPDDWLGTLGGVSDIYCKVTGTCKGDRGQSGQPTTGANPAAGMPQWVWIAGAVAAGLLLIYVIKD